MDIPWQIVEQAYNNGYEQGYKDAAEKDYWGMDKVSYAHKRGRICIR